MLKEKWNRVNEKYHRDTVELVLNRPLCVNLLIARLKSAVKKEEDTVERRMPTLTHCSEVVAIDSVEKVHREDRREASLARLFAGS